MTLSIGNRIPHEFFVTSGVGESDITVHAGSYHLALRAAGIEMVNVMTYSSILPAIAKQVPPPQGKSKIVHGEVMDCIQAVATAEYGSTASCGIIWAWLMDPNTSIRYGGLVCEYSGNLPESAVLPHLHEMLHELHVNGYEHLDLGEPRWQMESVTPTKMYGTALVSLCFQSYVVPLTPIEGIHS